MATRPCATPGCALLVKDAPRCPDHAQRYASRLAVEDVRARGSATARGYDAAWRTLRDGYLLLHPSCEACLGVGVTKPAKVVDHITPHRGNDSLRLDPTNLQSLCWSHHTRKTRTEGAGYRAPRPA